MSLLQKCWDAFVHPTIRLPLGFPLTGAKLGKSYVGATLRFYGGSFIPLSAIGNPVDQHFAARSQ